MTRDPEYIILGEWILSSNDTLLTNGAVVIGSGYIIEVGDQENIVQKYPSIKKIGGKNHFVIPGMISTHTHLFQTFLKGIGLNLSLRPWVQNVTSPAAITLNEKEAYLSAAFGILDAVHSGTTSIFEFSYAFPDHHIFDAIVQAYVDLGVRGWLGIGVNDDGEQYGVNPILIQSLDKIIHRLDVLTKSIREKSQGLLEPAIVTSSVRGLTKTGFQEISQYAQTHNLIFSMHVNETVHDNDVAQEKFNKQLIPALEEMGILSNQYLAVHCVCMTQEDIVILAENGVHISHNPVSNMYLGSGIAPIIEMIQAGIPISLGVDGAASNNSQDMLENLKFTALGQRVRQKNSNCFHAKEALQMATEGGAKALQASNQLGMIKPGYKADLTVLNFNSAKSNPVFDPIATLVFNSSPDMVDTVFIDGKIVLQNGKAIKVDEEKIIQEGNTAAKELIKRAKIQTR